MTVHVPTTYTEETMNELKSRVEAWAMDPEDMQDKIYKVVIPIKNLKKRRRRRLGNVSYRFYGDDNDNYVVRAAWNLGGGCPTFGIYIENNERVRRTHRSSR